MLWHYGGMKIDLDLKVVWRLTGWCNLRLSQVGIAGLYTVHRTGGGILRKEHADIV